MWTEVTKDNSELLSSLCVSLSRWQDQKRTRGKVYKLVNEPDGKLFYYKNRRWYMFIGLRKIDNRWIGTTFYVGGFALPSEIASTTIAKMREFCKSENVDGIDVRVTRTYPSKFQGLESLGNLVLEYLSAQTGFYIRRRKPENPRLREVVEFRLASPVT